MAGDGRLRELEDRYEGYTVYDSAGEKIGKVDEIFLDETDHEEYIGVKMGLFGLSGTTLVPMEISRVDERERRIDVSETKDHVKDAPTYRDDDDVDVRFEDSIRRHFNLAGGQSSAGQGSVGRAVGTDATGAEGAAAGDNTLVGGSDTPDRHSGASMGGAEDQERVGRESYQNREDMGSESAMGAAGAGDAAPSGGIPDLETGPSRADNEDVGNSMTRGHHEEPGERPGGAEHDDHSNRQAAATGGSDAGGGAADPGEHSGSPAAGPGDKEFDDIQDYQSATTGFQPSEGGETGGGDQAERDKGGPLEEEGGRPRVRRIRR